jgi:hypothetical protein
VETDNNTPEFRSISDAERPELERLIREAGIPDAEVSAKADELKASGIVVSSAETGKLSVYQQREIRTVADALANLKPQPEPAAPKKETRAEQRARVLAELAAGGNPGSGSKSKPGTDADAMARTAAFQAERRKELREGDGRRQH